MTTKGDALDDRFVRETGQALEIANLAEPILDDLGLRLVRVIVSGRNGCTVQVMIERKGEILTVDDCASVSRQLSPLLDAYDPIDGKYHLEVSSPGLDRPLVRLGDFEDWTGYEAKIELSDMIDGRKRFRGLIEAVENGEVRLKLTLDGYDGPQVIGIAPDMIASAKLVMNDDLLKAALSNTQN